MTKACNALGAGFVFLALLPAAMVHAADYSIQATGTAYRVVDSLGLDVQSSTSAHTAIQWAIDNSGDDGTVTLGRGTYPLASVVTMKPGVTLTGKGRGTQLTLAGTNSIPVRALDADDSTISHLAVTHQGSSGGVAGIQLDSCDRCRVSNVITLGFDYGIHALNGSRSLTIERCSTLAATIANIFLEDIATIPGERNLIEGAAVFWGGRGLVSTGGNGLDIVNSMFHRNKSRGIDVGADDVLLTGSRVYWNEDDGARFTGNGTVVTGNILTFTEGNNLAFDGVDGGLIQGNAIIDAIEETLGSFTGLKSGLVMNNTSNVIVEGNTIYNWHVFEQGPMRFGIWETASSSNNTIRYNTIHYWHTAAIQSNGGATSVHDNTTSDPTGDGNWLLDMDNWDGVCNAFVNAQYKGSPSNDDFVVAAEENNYRVYAALGGGEVFSSPDARVAIQWAIDNTSVGGGEVLIENGTYPLSAELALKRNVWLHGRGANTVLQATGGQSRCIVMDDADFAVLSDLRIVDVSGARTGIYNVRSGFVRIQDIWVEGFDTGIEDHESVMTAIDGCRLKGNNAHIVFKGTSGMHSNDPNASIIGRYVQRMATRNIISGGKIGISVVNEAISINLTDNIFIGLSGPALRNEANATLFANNTTYQIGDVVVDNTTGGAYRDRELTLVGNVMSYHQGHTMATRGWWGTVVGNTIRDTGVGVGGKHGLFLADNRNYVVAYNDIRNGPQHFPMANGVREAGFDNVIAANAISGYSSTRVRSNGSGTITVANSGVPGSYGSSPWVADTTIDPDWAYTTLLDYIEKQAAGLDRKRQRRRPHSVSVRR